MKLKSKYLLGCCISVLICFLTFFGFLLFSSRVAGYYVGNSENEFWYKGQHYTKQDIQYKRETRLGKPVYEVDKRKHFDLWHLGGDVYTVNGDPNREYLYIYNGDYGYGYVRDGVIIPQSGIVTAVFIKHHEKSEDQSYIEMFKKITSLNGDFVEIKTNNFAYSESIYFAYNSCPVAIHELGRVIYDNENYYYVKKENFNNANNIFEGKAALIKEQNIINFINEFPLSLTPHR